MRAFALLVLAWPLSAHAELPGFTFGNRLSVSTELRPGWPMTGGQWRLSLGPNVSATVDVDGGHGPAVKTADVFEAHSWRSMFLFSTGLAYHPWHRGSFVPQLIAGTGLAAELTHLQFMGLDSWHEDTAWRPLGYAGIALQWLRRVQPVNPSKRDVVAVGVGLSVRGVYVAGNGPASMAPELDRISLQATLEANFYVE